MRVTYDPIKREQTLSNRGLDMAQAAEVFIGTTLTVEDDRLDYGEPRFITIGLLDGRMVVIVWTPRDDSYRISSMRKANVREQALYGKRLG
ncbi:BrnT family toxin [Pelagibacterium lacus]|uniref:BrnT family toxin n=1 Tax=Pelagibacterium lacus TaxID=2282655 RepID=A0A369W0D0_9HYPH|nr:BrnT family toxin [Pelagibacterium lacus]RDE08008.1 BrnT family toxin [Pelagibacterium lacus]